MTSPLTTLRAARALTERDPCECAFTAIVRCTPPNADYEPTIRVFTDALGIAPTKNGHREALYARWDAASPQERAAAWDRAEGLASAQEDRTCTTT